MASILIFDTDRFSKNHLSALLSQDNHNIRTASKNDEAITLAVKYQPAILIVRAENGPSAGGRSLAEALRIVLPDLEVLTISNPTQAASGGIPLEQIRQAVLKIELTGQQTSQSTHPVGLLEVNCFGDIVSVNDYALELIKSRLPATEKPNIRDIIGASRSQSLAPLFRQWIRVVSKEKQDLHICATWLTHRMKYLLILVEEKNSSYMRHPAVQTLLGISKKEQAEATRDETAALEKRVPKKKPYLPKHPPMRAYM